MSRALRLKTISDRRLREQHRMRAAFSLAELVVVMVIVAALAAVAIPRFAAPLKRQRLEAGARRVAADLGFVQRRARQTSSATSIRFDAGAASYEILGMADPDRPSQAYVVKLGEEPYGLEIKAVDFGGDGTLTFDGYGMPDAAGYVVLRLSGTDAQVTLDGSSGLTTLSY